MQVSTKDGALVCRPDITLDGNTNIAQDKSLRGRDSVQVCVALPQSGGTSTPDPQPESAT